MKLIRKISPIRLIEFLLRKIPFYRRLPLLAQKALAVTLTLLLILTSFYPLSFLFAKKTSAVWFDDQWGYRQTVAITNSGSNQTDFQVAITLDTATLITNGKMQSDCDDVRVTDINGKLIPHWIQTSVKACNASNTQIWTKVPSITTSGATVYVYYGNPSAASTENGKNVFTFFDDFNDGAIDPGWTQQPGSGTISETGGVMRLYCATTCDHWSGGTESGNFLYRARPSSGDYTFDAGISAFNNPDSSQAGLTEFTNNDNTSFWGPYDNATVDQIRLEGVHADSGVASVTIADTSNTGVVTAKVTRDSSTQYLFNGTSAGTNTNWANETNVGVMLKDWASANASTADFDWFFIRKFASTEPSVGSPASEEKSPGPIAYWKFDDGTGTNAQDSTANNKDGTLSGTTIPTWQTENQCISGKCLFYDGSTSYTLLPDLGVTTGTVSMWIRPTTVSGDKRLFAQFSGATTQAGSTAINQTSGETGSVWVWDGTAWQRLAANNTLTVNNWYHLAFVYSGGNVTLYVNGVEKSTVASAFAFSGVQMGLGAKFINTHGTTYGGFMDDVKIYNFARSAAQIKQDYASGLANAGSPEGGTTLGAKAEKYLSEGLVGYWKMNEASWTVDCSTTSVTDSSGNGNNGKACPTTTGPAGGAVGKFGNAGSFDGSNDYVAISDNAVYDWSKLTVSAWIYANDTTESGIVSKGIQSGSTMEYGLNVTSGAKLQFFIDDNGAWGPVASSVSTANVPTSQWTHVVGIYDGSTLKLFVNGTEVDSDSYSSGVLNSTGAINIGTFFSINASDCGGATCHFNGSIDDVRVYNRAFSSSEVSGLYNFAPGPVAYYNFEEKTGTSANDTSGNANTATLTGSPTWVSGKYGGGVDNGNTTSDYVDAPNVDLPAGDWTAMSWFKYPLTSTGASWHTLFRGSANDHQIIVQRSDMQLGMYDNAGATDFRGTGFIMSTLTAGWHHVATVGTGTVQNFYIDGVYVGQSNVKSTSDIKAIGNYQSGNQNWGTIDEVKIYNYARTSKQIVEDMNAGHPSVGSPVGSAVGHWKFDEGADNTCSGGTNDACNSGNQGSTLDGAESGMAVPATSTSGWTQAGKFGKALSFDGTNDEVVTYDTLLTTFTVSAWIKPTSVSSAMGIMGERSATTGTWAFYVRATGELGLTVVNGGDYTSSGAGLTAGSWQHVVAVVNGTSLTIYLNGRSVHTATISTVVSDSTTMRIGNDAVGTFYTGQIDEAKLYNYALTADEVKLDMNRSSSLVLGALSDNSSYQVQAANQEYCIPGDSTSCVAPVGRWDFEEGTGTAANDTSGNAKTGTLTAGPTWVSGKIGGAIGFDGTNDEITISDTTDPTAYTIEAWVRPSDVTSTNIFVRTDASGPTVSWSHQMRITSGSKFEHYTYDGAGKTITGSTTVAADTWYFVVATATNSGNGRLYVNGVEEGTAASITTLWTAGDRYRIGSNSGGSMGFFTGDIDHVRLFDYARSAAQIAWDYNRGAPIGHWKFDECQGTTAYDSSGNSNTGTITIGATGGNTVVGTCTTPTDGTGAWYDGVAGKRNYSLQFDGTDDYVAAPSGATTNLNITGNLSIFTWIKTSSNNVGIVSFGSNSVGTGYLFGIGQGGCATGILSFETVAGGWDCGSTTVNDNSWHLVGVTLSGTTLTHYIDGRSDGTDTSGAPDSWSGVRAIGSGNDGTANFLSGQIDDTRIYNYALTATQVKSLYNDGSTRFGPSTGAP